MNSFGRFTTGLAASIAIGTAGCADVMEGSTSSSAVAYSPDASDSTLSYDAGKIDMNNSSDAQGDAASSDAQTKPDTSVIVPIKAICQSGKEYIAAALQEISAGCPLDVDPALEGTDLQILNRNLKLIDDVRQLFAAGNYQVSQSAKPDSLNQMYTYFSFADGSLITFGRRTEKNGQQEVLWLSLKKDGNDRAILLAGMPDPTKDVGANIYDITTMQAELSTLSFSTNEALPVCENGATENCLPADTDCGERISYIANSIETGVSAPVLGQLNEYSSNVAGVNDFTVVPWTDLYCGDGDIESGVSAYSYQDFASTQKLRTTDNQHLGADVYTPVMRKFDELMKDPKIAVDGKSLGEALTVWWK